MMINKRLIGMVSESKKYIAGNIVYQWVSMVSNIGMIFAIASMLQKLSLKTADATTFIQTTLAVAVAIVIRFFCTRQMSKMGYLSSKSVKKKLRTLIYQKLLRLGTSYREQVATSEIVQLAVEGVEQLETYFGAYLPQFFYSVIAPITLFVVLSFVNLPSAIVLLICVPLIPVTIAAVQTFAKKLLSKYWSEYTTLGDTFLENLQGLTILKIYQSDKFKHEQMNEESERFRKITMKVLTMQLNSVTVMDAIAYGGAALGTIISVLQYRAGNVSLAGCISIILLSAEFFIPMRMLGSYFHIAMNGMAASDKIFKLLDLSENTGNAKYEVEPQAGLYCRDLHFSYEENREILHGVTMEFPHKSFTAIVGESGCGKSTVASILMGKNKGYQGTVKLGEHDLSEIQEESLMKNITYIGFDSYLFKGSVRDNLLMGAPQASDERLWEILEQVNLANFMRAENGLDTALTERGSNLSGGQRQRLALARAVLHDSPIYIFDEATSNVDAESENEIMGQIYNLAQDKTVILITHRLANALRADRIYVMQNGSVAESGKHDVLLKQHGQYAQLWNTQSSLEQYGKEKSYEGEK